MTIAHQYGNITTHMKTTVDIADQVLEQAKEVAFRDRTTLRELFQAGLVRELAAREGRGQRSTKLPKRAVGKPGGAGCWLDDWDQAKSAIRAPRDIPE